MKKRCLVVDDEPIAQQVLAQHIEKVELLELVGKCSNAIEALDMLHKEAIDIMFLDIKMPTMTGFELLKTLQNPPKVILTTAFAEFGVESYEYGVVDYLLKPIPFDRFLKAVNKLLMPEKVQPAPQNVPAKEGDLIFFKADKKIYKLYFNEILFIEGSGNYVKVYTAQAKPLMILDKLSELMEKLPSKSFCRVHKSYIVNVQKIKQVEGNRIKFDSKEVPVSATYKKDFDKLLAGNN